MTRTILSLILKISRIKIVSTIDSIVMLRFHNKLYKEFIKNNAFNI
jgi:hypothetical protein